MKVIRVVAVSAIVVWLLSTGCNSFTLSDKGSAGGEKLNIQKRAILSATVESKVRVCAEPSPDAMSAMAMEGAAKGGVPSQASAELSAALQQSAAFVGLRTASIQLLRDFGYRLCEAYLSAAIDAGQYDLLMRRFQKNVVALLAIEQLTGAVKAPPVVLTSRGTAETSQSLVDQQAVREKVSEKIAELEKEKKKTEDERAARLTTNAQADTKELDTQIAEKEAAIKRRKEDLAVIDKSIGNARSTLAGGETQATIQAGSSPASPSDQALKEVTAVVGQIAMAIVKSDDVVQLCLLALGSTTGSQDTTREKFATWCQKELELEQKKREIYLTTFPPLIEAAQAVISDPSKSADEKRGAKENLNRLSTELEREGLKYVIKPETNGIPIKPLDFLPNFFK